LRTAPDAGSAARSASPSATVMATAGIPGDATAIPPRLGAMIAVLGVVPVPVVMTMALAPAFSA